MGDWSNFSMQSYARISKHFDYIGLIPPFQLIHQGSWFPFFKEGKQHKLTWLLQFPQTKIAPWPPFPETKGLWRKKAANCSCEQPTACHVWVIPMCHWLHQCSCTHVYIIICVPKGKNHPWYFWSWHLERLHRSAFRWTGLPSYHHTSPLWSCWEDWWWVP